jgi:hypothetical protein
MLILTSLLSVTDTVTSKNIYIFWITLYFEQGTLYVELYVSFCGHLERDVGSICQRHLPVKVVGNNTDNVRET